MSHQVFERTLHHMSNCMVYLFENRKTTISQFFWLELSVHQHVRSNGLGLDQASGLRHYVLETSSHYVADLCLLMVRLGSI